MAHRDGTQSKTKTKTTTNVDTDKASGSFSYLTSWTSSSTSRSVVSVLVLLCALVGYQITLYATQTSTLQYQPQQVEDGPPVVAGYHSNEKRGGKEQRGLQQATTAGGDLALGNDGTALNKEALESGTMDTGGDDRKGFFVQEVGVPLSPTSAPTESAAPSPSPSAVPTGGPTVTAKPTEKPTAAPTESAAPSPSPSAVPSDAPSRTPSATPSIQPTTTPFPTMEPSVAPSLQPSGMPSVQPSALPSVSMQPSALPSVGPSALPSMTPSISMMPSSQPSSAPSISMQPSSAPTFVGTQTANFTVFLPFTEKLSPIEQLAFISGTEQWIKQVNTPGMDGTLSSPQVLIHSQSLVTGPAAQFEVVASDADRTVKPATGGTQEGLRIDFEVTAVYSGSNDEFDMGEALQPYFDEPDSLWIHLLGNYNNVFLTLRPTRTIAPVAATSPVPPGEGQAQLNGTAIVIMIFVAAVAVALAVAASITGVRNHQYAAWGEELHSPKGEEDSFDGVGAHPGNIGLPPTETITGDDDEQYEDGDGGDDAISIYDGMTVYDDGIAIQPHERPEDDLNYTGEDNYNPEYDDGQDVAYDVPEGYMQSQHQNQGMDPYDQQPNRQGEQPFGHRESDLPEHLQQHQQQLNEDTAVVHKMMEREDSIGDIFRSNYLNTHNRNSGVHNPDPPSAASEANYDAGTVYKQRQPTTSHNSRAPSAANSKASSARERPSSRSSNGGGGGKKKGDDVTNGRQSVVSEGATSLFSSLISYGAPKSEHTNESSELLNSYTHPNQPGVRGTLGARPIYNQSGSSHNQHVPMARPQQSFDDRDSMVSQRRMGGLYDVLAPAGQIGIIVDTTKDGPSVHSLKPNSPMLGLISPGDLIVGLDDQDTRGMTAATLTRLMAKKAHQKERKITLLAIE